MRAKLTGFRFMIAEHFWILIMRFGAFFGVLWRRINSQIGTKMAAIAGPGLLYTKASSTLANIVGDFGDYSCQCGRGFRLSFFRATEHIRQLLVVNVIDLKQWPRLIPRQMNLSQVDLECPSPCFLWTTSSTCSSGWCPMSISLRSWNADDREDVGCGLSDGIYALLLCLIVVWIRPFSRLPHCHWWSGDVVQVYEIVCVDTLYGPR